METLVEQTRGVQPWRKVLHAGCGLTIAASLVYLQPPRVLAAGVLGGLFLLLLLVDLLRLRSPELNRLFFRLFLPLVSPREEKGAASSTWFIGGSFLAVASFSTDAAISGLLVLSFADPAAALVGKRWGRRPLGRGTLEGSLTFAAVSSAVLVGQGLVSWPLGLLVAGVVTLVESAPTPVDDNLLIPVATSGAMAVALTLGG